MATSIPIILCSNKLLHRQLTRCLEGFSFSFACTGGEALDMLIESPPNLLILENDLPDMKGMSLLKIVKISYPHVLVIFLYDSQNPVLAIDAFRCGARDCFAKPVEPNALKEKVGLLITVVENHPQVEGNIFLNGNAQLDSHEQKNLQEVLSRRKAGVYQAIRFLNKNFHNDITLELVADAACMSKYHFSRTFKHQIGISCNGYLQGLRIKKAKQLLTNGNSSVTLICEAVGYNDLTHFERVFRKIVGVSPLAYRKKIKAEMKQITMTIPCFSTA